MIELKQANKIFTTLEIETHALKNINLSINKGDFISIMGPSGCGKSTLLNIIGLLDNLNSGELFIDGINVRNKTDKECALLRNEKFGFVFQSFHLIHTLNITQNIELPLLYSKKEIKSNARKELIEFVLEKVGLSHRTKHFPSQLSGGQCQRAAIARAIINNPEVILADEPTGNLDSKMGEEIMDLLLQLNQEGKTIIMVTHDKSIAQKTSKIIHMLDGEIIDR